MKNTTKESKITKETLLNFPFSEWETQCLICLMFIDPFIHGVEHPAVSGKMTPLSKFARPLVC